MKSAATILVLGALTIPCLRAGEPPMPEPAPLVDLADDGHPAISRVILKGENPEMIYVPIIHDDEFSHLAADGMGSVKDVMARCELLADHLYGRYGVRHVVLEGLPKAFVERYNRIPLEKRRPAENSDAGTIVHNTWSRLLAEKDWVLLPASDTPMVGPLTALGREYDALIVGALDGARQSGWLRNREVFMANREKLQTSLGAVAREYNARRGALLEADPGLKSEYAITVTQRNKAFLDYLLEPDEPGIAFFGAGHWQDLEKQLEERGVAYAIVVPGGVPWPPEHKDDDAIYADMLELGAKLRNCTLRLGDGVSAEIIIPID